MHSCFWSLVHPQVLYRGNGLQIWRVAVNVLSKQLQTADNEWSSSLGVEQGANISSL